MNVENVMRMFGKFAGIDEDDVTEYRFLCESSVENISAKTLVTETENDKSRLEYAAAVLAYYRYVLLSFTDESGGSITVGEISIKNPEKRLEYAERMLKEALDDIKAITGDNDFVFERI